MAGVDVLVVGAGLAVLHNGHAACSIRPRRTARPAATGARRRHPYDRDLSFAARWRTFRCPQTASDLAPSAVRRAIAVRTGMVRRRVNFGLLPRYRRPAAQRPTCAPASQPGHRHR